MATQETKVKKPSRNTREVNEQQTADYLKRPRAKIGNPNKDLKKAYEKNKQFDDPKFDHFRQLKKYRKQGAEQDSVSQHGGTDDEDFDVRAEAKKKSNKRKLDIGSSEDELQMPKRVSKKKPTKSGKVTVKKTKILDVKKVAIEQKQTEAEQPTLKQPEPTDEPQKQLEKVGKEEQKHSSQSQHSEGSSGKSAPVENNNEKGSYDNQLSPDQEKSSSSSGKQENQEESEDRQNREQPEQGQEPNIAIKNEMQAQQKVVKDPTPLSLPPAAIVKSEEEASPSEESKKQSEKNSALGHQQSESQQVDLSKRLQEAIANRQESDKVVKMKKFKIKKGRAGKKSKPIAKQKQIARAKVGGKNKKQTKSILKPPSYTDSPVVPEKQTENVKVQTPPKKVTIHITEPQPREDDYLPPKTRAKVNVKLEDNNQVVTLAKYTMRRLESRARRGKQRFTQMNLKGQVADMSKEAPLESTKKEKEPYEQLEQLKIEEGQQLIKGYMRPRSFHHQAIKSNPKQAQEPASNKPSSAVATAVTEPEHPKQENLSIQNKVVLESFLFFCTPRSLQTSRQRPRKTRTKYVVMQSDQEEPVQYVYKRKRPQNQAVRRYRKIIYADSGDEEIHAPRIHKKGRYQPEQQVEVPERRKSRRRERYEEVIVKPGDENKRKNEINVTVYPQEQE